LADQYPKNELFDWDDNETIAIAEEFFVPSVKQKAVKDVIKNVDNWDDDFEEDVFVDDKVLEFQNSLQNDISNFKKFDLHVKG
jgi:hypothetical protein